MRRPARHTAAATIGENSILAMPSPCRSRQATTTRPRVALTICAASRMLVRISGRHAEVIATRVSQRAERVSGRKVCRAACRPRLCPDERPNLAVRPSGQRVAEDDGLLSRLMPLKGLRGPVVDGVGDGPSKMGMGGPVAASITVPALITAT